MSKEKTMQADAETAKTKPTRFVLTFKFWKDGEETPSNECTMTTDSLRTARAEFRRQLRMLVHPAVIDAANMKRIVEAGYVVASGSFPFDYADRFAMVLKDALNPVEHPPMYAFEQEEDGWSMSRFTYKAKGA